MTIFGIINGGFANGLTCSTVTVLMAGGEGAGGALGTDAVGALGTDAVGALGTNTLRTGWNSICFISRLNPNIKSFHSVSNSTTSGLST